MQRRRVYWLAGAVILFVVAALLATWDERREPEPTDEATAPRFPRGFRPGEWQRAKRRRRPLPRSPVPARPADPAGAAAAAPDDGATREEEPHRDPVLVALAAVSQGGSLMVLEANVLRHTPVGERLLACMSPQAKESLSRLREEVGVDPLEQIDRVALGDGALLLSGHFDQARWDTMFAEHTVEPYGAHGRLYTPPVPETGAAGDEALPPPRQQDVAGVWRDELLVFGRDAQRVQQAFDELEGRRPPSAAPLDENQTYGEAYGVLSVDDAAKLFPADQQELAERFRQAAQSIEIHVDARQDLALVAEVGGDGGEALEDLARALGGVLALGRLKARADGAERLVELLDHARVQPLQGETFTLELALPLELIERHLGDCAQLDGAPSDGPQDRPGDTAAP